LYRAVDVVDFYITVGLGIVTEHTALDCHWLVAGVDRALLGQFLRTPAVDFLLELGALLVWVVVCHYDLTQCLKSNEIQC